jgi:hypothetical protein
MLLSQEPRTNINFLLALAGPQGYCGGVRRKTWGLCMASYFATYRLATYRFVTYQRVRSEDPCGSIRKEIEDKKQQVTFYLPEVSSHFLSS